MTAATLVGLMSIPALAVLYGGLVQKKWAINTVMMVFTTFGLVLIVWVLWGYKLAFGTPLVSTFIGDPRTVLGHSALQGQANIPLLNGLMPNFRIPAGSVIYFQFVFAAITPILFIGAVIGRVSFKVWLVFVPLWITFAYCVNAFLLWGGGYWAGKGALDFSGGYVIHLAAGTSGFVAAAVIGPRLKRDRERAIPNNLLFVAVGAGILWLGWNGFNGGDPYFAGADAASAIVNTNLATAVAMLTWIIMDMTLSSEKKPTFLGALNGMICGLVGITPAAGYVNGFGAIVIGLVCSAIVWVAWYYLPKYVWPFNKVDDALGVVYTHGFAGLFGGLLVGLLADPNMIVYLGLGKNPSISGTGLFYGHPHQLLVQLEAALTIIIWDAVVTFLILMVIKHVFRMKLRLPDEVLEIGDVAVHGEEVLGGSPPPKPPDPRSVPAEGLLQPPGTVGRRDLGVDEQRAGPRAVQPAAHRGEIGHVPHGDALEAEPPADRGDVGRREPHDVERVAVRAEVMDLRAVGLVVVDDHHHRQAEAGDGLQLADAHQRAAVAQRGDRQPVRPGDRGPDGGGQAEPDGLERLRKAETRLVGNRQEHARIAHEVARVHGHGPLRGQHVVQRDGQRARVDRLPVALVLERHVPPASLLRDPRPHLRRPVSRRTR
jgi:Amt family ammonium transporter